MSKMNMFARLVKVDEGKRLVTGLLASETPDVDGEIFDYDVSKPNFAEWSSICHKASGGKSVGNLRAMHGKVAAGNLTEIIMDDLSKSIMITANVVDDNEWEKIQKGVYSGFSVGGSYGRKWKDETSGYKRYEAKPSEASLADIPCNLDCTFEVLKINGTKELRKFIGGGATDETVEASGEGDSAASSDSADSQPSPVVLNKAVHADMLKALEKMPEGADRDAAKEWLEKTFKVSEDPDAPAAVAEEPPPVEPDELTKVCTKIIALAKDNETAANLIKSMFGYDGKPELAKGLCDVGNLCDLFSRLGWARDNAKYEAAVEGDGSAVPAMFAKVMRSLGDVLIAMVQEEVSEALSKTLGGEEDEDFDKSIDVSEDIPELRRLTKALAVATRKQVSAVNEGLKLLKCAKGESVIDGIKRVMAANEKLTKTLGESERGASDLNKIVKAKDAEIDELKKAMKLPAADSKAPKLKVVGKGGDISGTGDEEGGTVEKVMGHNGEVDEVATAIKASHQAGGQTLEKKLFGNGTAR